MALMLKPIRLDCGLEIKDLYFKVTLVSYNDEFKELSFAGACYINQEAARDGVTKPIEGLRISGNFPYTNKTGNWCADVYEYIKEQAERMRGKTEAQIREENDEAYLRVMGTFEPPVGIQDPVYLNMLDAKDC